MEGQGPSDCVPLPFFEGRRCWLTGVPPWVAARLAGGRENGEPASQRLENWNRLVGKALCIWTRRH